MKLNTAPKALRTYEGATACHLTPLEQLRRSVMACMLWESNFYESGDSIADCIKALIPLCKPEDVASIAVEARENQHLRHVPLLLVRELARQSSRNPAGLVSTTLAKVIQRPDELAEFLAMYWSEGRKPIAKQVKLGLALAFQKFDEYSLAKYSRDASIKLRDVLFMVHAKPKDAEQAALWKRLVDDKLATPDTWEVALSAGADKKETFERLINENKLGGLALLRNLRNMYEAKVDSHLIFPALQAKSLGGQILPFRFIAAARAVPAWEAQIDEAMQTSMLSMRKLYGNTAILIDVSWSMRSKLSAKSDLSRLDAAKALAILIRGITLHSRVFTFNTVCEEVPARQGMALADAIGESTGGTFLRSAIVTVRAAWPAMERFIVITDEQTQDGCLPPGCKGYMINVSCNQNGVGYGEWTKISGFSESVVEYISCLESQTSFTP